MITSLVLTDDSKLLQESNLTAWQPRRAPITLYIKFIYLYILYYFGLLWPTISHHMNAHLLVQIQTNGKLITFPLSFQNIRLLVITLLTTFRHMFMVLLLVNFF